MSDFTNKIFSKNDYEIYVQNQNDKDINKVLLFTKKDNLSPAIKALSAEFKDLLRIVVIHVPDSKATQDNKDLMADYEVDKAPKIIVEETYDAGNDKLLDQYRIHEFKE